MTVEFASLRRCAALALCGVLAGWLLAGWVEIALAADTSVLRGKNIPFVEPYGPNSVTNVPIALMRAEIARKSGATIDIISMGGRAGGTALDFINSPQDRLVFAVLDLISRELAEKIGERPPLLATVQPVALVSGAITTALIVAEPSPIKTIDDFVTLARSRQLRIAHLGRKVAFGLELAMLEQKLGLHFADKVVGTRAEILAALASGEADASFLVTLTLLPSAEEAAPPVRAILTFGAKRNPDLATVPTLAERTSDPKAAIASSIAVFAPRDTPAEMVAALESVLGEVAAEPAIKKEAASRNFPLKVSPDAAVTAAMKRDARVIGQHMSYLNR